MFLTASKTELNKLEVIYHQALRFATGLPKRTPIQINFAEINQTPLRPRLQFLVLHFYLKQAALKFDVNYPYLTRQQIYNPTSSPFLFKIMVDTAVLPRLRRLVSLSWLLKDWSRDLNLDAKHLIHYRPTIVQKIIDNNKIKIHLQDLPFQDNNLPDQIINQLFQPFKINLRQDTIIISTDASKDQDRTKIAAVNIFSGDIVSGQIHYGNSVLTAEALAIYMAIKSFVNEKKTILSCQMSFHPIVKPTRHQKISKCHYPH